MSRLMSRQRKEIARLRDALVVERLCSAISVAALASEHGAMVRRHMDAEVRAASEACDEGYRLGKRLGLFPLVELAEELAIRPGIFDDGARRCRRCQVGEPDMCVGCRYSADCEQCPVCCGCEEEGDDE